MGVVAPLEEITAKPTDCGPWVSDPRGVMAHGPQSVGLLRVVERSIVGMMSAEIHP
jgi:hypothetical protein